MVRVEFNLRLILLIFGILLFAWIVYLVRGTVVLLGIAVMLMATLHPLVKLAERRGLSHTRAVALVMLALVFVPLAIVAVLTPLIISEVQDFAHSLPTLQQHADNLLRHWGMAGHVDSALARTKLQDRLGSVAGEMAAPTMAFIADVFEVVVVAGYLLADSRRLQLVMHEFLPRRSERHIEPLLEGMERVVGGYIRGQCITSGMFGGFVFLYCLLLGVPYPLLLGIIAAVGDVIPLFGVQLAMAAIALVAFTHSTWQMIAVLVGCIAYGQLESHILVPRIYARTVNLPPLMVIVATIIGARLYGIVGVLIGIPIVGVLRVVLDYIVAERRRGWGAAAAQMEAEPTDVVDQVEKEEEAEAGARPSPALDGSAPDEGIPAPTYSPFEAVPEVTGDEGRGLSTPVPATVAPAASGVVAAVAVSLSSRIRDGRWYV